MALIALGVCGGIGAYKAIEVARGLQKRGHDVAATDPFGRDCRTVTFEAITHRRVTQTRSPGRNSDTTHRLATEQSSSDRPATATSSASSARHRRDFLTLYTWRPVPHHDGAGDEHNSSTRCGRANGDARRAASASSSRSRATGVRLVGKEGWRARRLVDAADAICGLWSLSKMVVVTAGQTTRTLPTCGTSESIEREDVSAWLREAARRAARVVLVFGPSALRARM